MKIHNLILGAGISGLSLGYVFQKNDHTDYLILESESKAGGLCRSFKLLGTYYDIGAHALHKASYEESELLQDIIDKKDLYCQQRKAFVCLFGKVIPHPIQYHMYFLPLKNKMRGLFSFLFASRGGENKTLKEWLESRLGKYICEVFLFPYNEKVWQINLNKISTEWTERVPSNTLRVLQGTILPGDKNYSSNEYVCYPQKGGFERLLNKLLTLNKNKVLLNNRVVSIDLEGKVVKLENGSKFSYKNLISTIPVDNFMTLISSPKNNRLLRLSHDLQKVSICLVTFITKKVRSDIQRVYIPEKKYFAQRVIINSNSSPLLRNYKHSVISLEISYLKKGDLQSKRFILANCKKLLTDLKLVKSENNIIKTKIDYFEHAYPIQTNNKNQILDQIKKYLRRYNCYTLGRFGSWDYSNIDGIVQNSQEVARVLLKV